MINWLCLHELGGMQAYAWDRDADSGTGKSAACVTLMAAPAVNFGGRYQHLDLLLHAAVGLLWAHSSCVRLCIVYYVCAGKSQRHSCGWLEGPPAHGCILSPYSLCQHSTGHNEPISKPWVAASACIRGPHAAAFRREPTLASALNCCWQKHAVWPVSPPANQAI